jgi:Na+/melibiose symporter-like transporter
VLHPLKAHCLRYLPGVLALGVCLYLSLTTVEIRVRESNPPAGAGAGAAQGRAGAGAGAAKGSDPSAAAPGDPPAPAAPIAWYAQPLVRWVALMTSWATTLAVATYALFATQYLGYTQSSMNAVFSTGAALAVCVQLGVVPALSRRMGEATACAVGLVTLGVALFGCSVISTQVPTPYTLHPQPYTLSPQPYTLNPTPSALNPTPSTPNPQP